MATANPLGNFLKEKHKELEKRYDDFERQASTDCKGLNRILLMAWLAEVKLTLAELERKLLDMGDGGQNGFSAIWIFDF